MRIALVALAFLAFAGCRTESAPKIVKLTPDTVVVGAWRYWDAAFKVPASATAYVEGHVSAIGGTGNDIDIYVLDSDGFENFVNHHQFREYYEKTRTSAATVEVGPLRPGAYFLVFGNRFSAVSKKTVVSNIEERIIRR